ncbi:hypothetical protein L210DRAFT_3652345 [Boletus edulis BED1]|uniref:Uncharacterized protein n=1 Tax=Boletus edulis BED1 TaxID=1328754 RepID=A0AAD4BGY4_BOLED|nr:hypothetical protein L210DRAFT_3652345 [Boletus edulis BED1]
MLEWEDPEHSPPTKTSFPEIRLERWMRGAAFQNLQVKLCEMNSDASDIEPFLRAIRPESALTRAWAKKAQAIAGAVVDAVQAETAAANVQLEKSKVILDFVSSRVENLGQQLEAARRNKVLMDVLCAHL